MESVKLDSVFRGLLRNKGLWSMFFLFWAVMTFIAVTFLLVLTIAPVLNVYAIIVPILPLLGLSFWKLKEYKTRFVDPVDDAIRQANIGERIGIFLFICLFLGAIGWGINLSVLFWIYNQMTGSFFVEYGYLLSRALVLGFAFGAFIAAFKYASIFNNRKFTYALCGFVGLLFILDFIYK